MSSLDCLSSIVERISTESPAAPALLLADPPPESSPGPHEAAAADEDDRGAPTPTPEVAPPCPGDANPNPIYQVL